MKKKIKIVKGYEDFDISDFACEYCHQTPDETEIQLAYASDTYICGDIDCWNNYCMEWVWNGNVVEVEEKEIDVCDGCHEDEDTSYDGMCMPCWEDLNEHLEENKNDK